MLPRDTATLEDLHQRTGHTRVRLRDWESIKAYQVDDDVIRLVIDTYDVQVMVREDRYKAHGTRLLFYKKLPTGRWVVDTDSIIWDEDFVPYVYEKFGRRRTAEEFTEQREWEKMCYRPGSKSTPLDSYDRVTDPFIRSTDKMERHF
jgi:hypothetical protein